MKKILGLTAAALLLTAGAASAQTASSSGWGNATPLLNQVAGKFNLTANVGAVYNFASNWTGGSGNDFIGKGKQNVAPAYGASLGWTSKTGFGVSADYLGFHSAWDQVYAGRQYDSAYNAVTFTPSYRFSFGQGREWGLRLGLGLGFSIADVKWASGAGSANGAAANGVKWGNRAAGGAYYSVGSNNINSAKFSDTTGSNYNTTLTGHGKSITDICSLLPGSGGNIVNTNSISDSEDAHSCITFGTIIGNNSDAGIAAYLWGLGYQASDLANLGAIGNTSRQITQTGNAEHAASTFHLFIGGNKIADGVISALKKLGCDAGTASDCASSGSGSGTGAAKDDAGLIIAPQVALEYDNGLFHGDVSLRYIHELVDVKFNGQNGGPDQKQAAGPLALFLGTGFGVNF